MAETNSSENRSTPHAYGPEASHRARPGASTSPGESLSADLVGSTCPYCDAPLTRSKNYGASKYTWHQPKHTGVAPICLWRCPAGHFTRQLQVRKDNAVGSKRNA